MEKLVKEKDSKSDTIVKIAIYGTPALLILLGFIAYYSGFILQQAISTVENSNLDFKALIETGAWMLTIGVAVYFIEFVARIYIMIAKRF